MITISLAARNMLDLVNDNKMLPKYKTAAKTRYLLYLFSSNFINLAIMKNNKQYAM